MDKKVLITGVHRSGTTHLGKILEATLDCSVIHEPFNACLGDSRVNYWYCNESVNDFLVSSKFRFKPRLIKRAPNESYIRTLGRSILGGEFEKSLKSFEKKPFVLIKDPFMFRQLNSNLWDYKFLVVKHPLSNLFSVKSQNWSISKNEFSKDIFSSKKYFSFSDKLSPFFDGNEIDFLWLWFFLHHEVMSELNNTIIIWHSDFCENPFSLFEAPVFVDNRASKDNFEKIIRETMFDKTIVRNDKLHQMKRNSVILSMQWVDSFSEKQIEVVNEIFGEIIEFYKLRSFIKC